MEPVQHCPTCEREQVFRHESREQEYEVRDEVIVLSVPLWVCSDCGESIVDDEFGDPARAAFDRYRENHRLLKPEEIEQIRSKWGLSQAAFAALLGMSQATINRYEGGALQQEKEDELIRMCYSPEHMKGLLARRGHVLTDRQRRAVELALEGTTSDQLTAMWSGFFESVPCEVSVRSGFRRFDFNRFAAVVVWLCQNVPVVTQTKLYKLLFYADFLCFRTNSRSLTGALYKQMPYGPVPAAYEVLRSRLEAEDLVQVCERMYENGRTGEEFLLGPRASQVKVDFDDEEQRVLEFVRRELGRLTPSEISDRSHSETAWRETPPKEVISYEKAMELSLPSCQENHEHRIQRGTSR